MNLDPLLPVVPDGTDSARGWPRHEVGALISYLPLSEVLTRHFSDGDAHAGAYSVPHVPRRLTTSGTPAYQRLADGVPMVVFLWDFDCSAAHRAMGGSSLARADDAWWADTVQRCQRLAVDYPRPFVHRTRGGAHIIYRLALPHVIRDGAGELAWTRRYLSALAMLSRRYGIVCDPSIADWPRLVRLPHTRRDGKLQLLDTWGDPRNVGTFSYEPTAAEEAADLDHVRQLATHDARWRPKLARLAGNVVLGSRTRSPRSPRPVEAPALTSDVLGALAEDLGAALRRHHGRHQIHLALAGACYDRGVPLEQGPALARAICAASGESDDRPQVWATTAAKVREGHNYTGFGQLLSLWPDLAAVVDAALPQEGGAQAAREELDGRGTPPEVAAVDAAPKLRAAIADAPLGLSLVSATEGSGKTRSTVDVVREAARAAAHYERVPSTAKFVYVAPDHNVAGAVAAQLRGERVAYWRGVLSVRADDGTPACRYHLPVLPLAAAGHSSRTFCEGCDLDGECPAQEGAIVSLGPQEVTPVGVVTVHAYLAEALAWAGPSAKVIIDEDPEAIAAHTLARSELEGAAAAEDLFAKSEAFRAPVLRALAAGLERGVLPQGPDALQQVFARGCAALVGDEGWCSALEASFGPLPIDADAVLSAYAWRVVWHEQLDEQGAMSFRRRGAWAPRPTVAERAKVYRRATDGRLIPASRTHALVAQLVAGVVRAPSPDGRQHDERGACAVEVDHRDPSRRVLRLVIAEPAVGRAVRRLAPTVLLDATGNSQLLDVLAGGSVPVTELRLADGAPVTRRLLYWSHASRAAALIDGRPRWDSGLGRYLSAALDQALAFVPAPRVAFFTWKALADVLRVGSDPFAVELLNRVSAAGGEVVFGHYGAARGRDDWMDCDVLVSLGDPRPNLGATRAIAAVLGLSADHGRVYRHATSAEVSQVSGRLRAPWRTKPALHLHVGTVPGLRWDARAEVLELPRGPTAVLDPAAVEQAVRVHGSKRLAAAALGVTRRTVQRTDEIPMPFAQSQGATSNAIRYTTAAPVAPCDTAKPLGNSAKTPSTWDPARARTLIEAVGGAVKAAQLLGIAKGTVYHWLKGARPAPQDALRALQEAVDAMAEAPVPSAPTEPATPRHDDLEDR